MRDRTKVLAGLGIKGRCRDNTGDSLFLISITISWRVHIECVIIIKNILKIIPN
ncbi:conserved protein of unknown function [Tepidanaerobacter acetatoxydans Re1]|uniref:Uncharacterized protein n=1 Tax=Tepidanaerobacter acetatoxydans (strain DSM 21804 / JCM 16047 / Re1) TaxID=1209989 RepID=F4LXG5_TEPAE|nr:hypothetical protein TepRe1_0896 [Tepidanaerobacter acetatoxydans Re1]CDI40533.1 conserved protein of unknown function [Tepidanaerobacter acetatoxydans Re1]